MEDEEFIRNTLSNIISTQSEIERSQRGIANAIEALQKRIKNNSRLEAWEAVQREDEVRHRQHRIKKYGTDEPTLSDLYGSKKMKTVGYDEKGEVRVPIPYYTCLCSQVGRTHNAQKHDSGCPFYIMDIEPKRGMSDAEIDKILDELEKRYNGKDECGQGAGAEGSVSGSQDQPKEAANVSGEAKQGGSANRQA